MYHLELRVPHYTTSFLCSELIIAIFLTPREGHISVQEKDGRFMLQLTSCHWDEWQCISSHIQPDSALPLIISLSWGKVNLIFFSFLFSPSYAFVTLHPSRWTSLMDTLAIESPLANIFFYFVARLLTHWSYIYINTDIYLKMAFSFQNALHPSSILQKFLIRTETLENTKFILLRMHKIS